MSSLTQLIKDFPIVQRMRRLVTSNAITGALEVNGDPVTGSTPYTLAQFLALTIANYAGYTILVSDIPAARSSINGVLVECNAAGTGWRWIQTPSFTTANLPDAATANGWGNIFISDVGENGGSYWRSNGTRFRPAQTAIVLSNITSSIALSTMPTAATVAKQVPIPVIDGKSAWGDGDILEIHQSGEKTGTADITHTAMYIGTNTRVLDDGETNTIITTYSTGTGVVITPIQRRILRKSSTSVKVMGAESLAGLTGTTGTKPADVTVTDLDTAPAYLDATLRVGASTTDTGLTLSTHTVVLIAAGAA